MSGRAWCERCRAFREVRLETNPLRDVCDRCGRVIEVIREPMPDEGSAAEADAADLARLRRIERAADELARIVRQLTVPPSSTTRIATHGECEAALSAYDAEIWASPC